MYVLILELWTIKTALILGRDHAVMHLLSVPVAATFAEFLFCGVTKSIKPVFFPIFNKDLRHDKASKSSLLSLLPDERPFFRVLDDVGMTKLESPMFSLFASNVVSLQLTLVGHFGALDSFLVVFWD